jgi:gliding motility-associated lipoprotein GldH
MRAFKRIFYLFPVLMIGLLSACSDPGAVIDKSAEIDNHNWTYVNLVKYDVTVDDPAQLYNLYLNLRVTGDYRYSNLFILFHQSGPALKAKTTRFEFKLANTNGEWLGSGSGNLYSFQIPFITNYKFPAKGVYHLAVEQNMRDNPLHEVSDVGLRVEKAK